VIESLILRTGTRVLMPLLLLFGLFLLLRGHNAPGGGFAGGLVVSAAYALYCFAFGMAAARRALPADPSRLIGAGLLLTLGSGVFPVALGRAFLTSLWVDPGKGIGTPMLFDVGVFLVVVGVVLTMTFTLWEE
jgi:multicomponent Na+:H+ antiporter subunit B